MLSSAALAQDDDTDFTFTGDVKNVCAALQYSTKAVNISSEYLESKKEEIAEGEQLLLLWANLIAESEIRTGVSIEEVDSVQLARLMAEYEKEAEPVVAVAAEEEESWTAFDISRTALTAASLADPTGLTGVAAAYTYPKCGTEEAEKGVGGFCWKDSYGRGFGKLPKSFGRVADCPTGFTNNGLFCGKGASTYSAPSRLADCPIGFTNTGVSCFKGASTYSAASRVANCPSGYTNNGLFCGRGASTYYAPSRLADCPRGYRNTGISCYKPPFGSKSLSSTTCPRGYFKGFANRCYKRCRSGYTNNGEFCGRGASTLSTSSMSCPSGYFLNKNLGRCYVRCKSGYTNNGEFCGRGARSMSLSNATCPSGYFKGALNRCYRKCRSGYTNNGEFCGRGAEVKGLASMTCKSNEFFKAGRCYDRATTCQAGYELDNIHLCYPQCKRGFNGVGPVCWSGCSVGKLKTACAAGCASSGAECGLATTDMVLSPLESAASIATLSGYSGAKSARKAATIAARKAAQSALVKGGKKMIKTGVKKLDNLLEVASKATGTNAAKKAAVPLTKAFIKNASVKAAKAGRKAKHLRQKGPEVLKKMLTKVFAPVVDKTKLAGRTGWRFTKKGWVKVKSKISKDKPSPPGWEFEGDMFPGVGDTLKALSKEGAKAVKARAQVIYRSLKKKRDLVAAEESVQILGLVHKCTTAGFTVSQAALR